MWETLALLYLRSSKCFSKTTSLLKADITQKEPTTSVYKIEFQSFKETEKKLTTVRKEYAIDQLVTFALSTQSY